MSVYLDLETYEMTAPKNFFDYITKQNAVLEAPGVLNADTEITAEKLIRKAFETSLSNTQKYLRTNQAPGKTAKK